MKKFEIPMIVANLCARVSHGARVWYSELFQSQLCEIRMNQTTSTRIETPSMTKTGSFCT